MIRLAIQSDLSRIDEIYNQAIEDKFCTVDAVPLTRQQRQEWFDKHQPATYPVYVYDEGDLILGWASISPYRSGRDAVAQVAEISYYIDFNHHGKGIASRLIMHAINDCQRIQKRIYFATIIEGNETSISLLKKFGFEQWGYFPQAVQLNDELIGHIFLGKIL